MWRRLWYGAILCTSVTRSNALGLWWNTPGRIIKFESTLVTPATPIRPLASNQAQFVWPGMEPADQGAVLQNVINGQGGNCPNEFFEGGFPVYPGDLITNTFTLNPVSGIWLDGASITRSSAAIAAAQAPFQASFHFNPEIYPASTMYQMAYLVIELQQGAQWDWGKVIFQDITIEAETTNTTWCTAPLEDPHNGTWTVATPLSLPGSGTTTCYINHVEMNGP